MVTEDDIKFYCENAECDRRMKLYRVQVMMEQLPEKVTVQ